MLTAYRPNAPKQASAEPRKKKQRKKWLTENHRAINVYNEYVDTHGVFSDGLRSF
jgi:antitoxin CcdA